MFLLLARDSIVSDSTRRWALGFLHHAYTGAPQSCKVHGGMHDQVKLHMR